MLRRAIAVLLASLTAVLLALPARADVLREFTGYTRPGVPTGRVVKEKPGKFRFVADAGEVQSPLLGGTVYFMVLDLQRTAEEELEPGLVRDLIKAFKPGEDGAGRSSPDYDRGARYLYLYQVVNDMPATETGVRSSSVFLLEAGLVTSWGHFVGHGFTLAETEKQKRVIRPVSSAHVVDADNWQYRDPDREHVTEQLVGIDKYASIDRSGIRLGTGEDPVRSPDRVVLVAGVPAYERGAAVLPGTMYYGPAPVRHLSPLGPPCCPLPGAVEVLPPPAVLAPGGALRVDRADRSFLRASWLNGNVLRPRERSALYGFTSNQPPTYEDVQLRGVRITGIKPAAGEAGVVPAVGPAPVGRVPVPVPPPAEAVGLLPMVGGGALGSLGGVIPSGGGGGVGFAPPGLVSIPSSAGGFGGTGGGGNGNGRGPATAPGAVQPQAPPQVNVNVNVQQTANPQQTVNQQQTVTQQQTVKQQQSQSQKQTQSQKQSQEVEIIPEPAAFLSALLGLPALLLLRRRKTSKTANAA